MAPAARMETIGTHLQPCLRGLIPLMTSTRTARALTLALAMCAILGTTVGTSAAASPLGSLAPLPTCEGPAPQVTPFAESAPPVLGWHENLAFDGRGRMWVSSPLSNKVEGFDSSGRLIATVPIAFPSGVAVTPDGDVVVVTDPLITSPTSSIYAFDPDAPHPAPRLVATLPSGKNGLASDSEGNLYTTGILAPTVTKVRPDGSVDHEWSDQATVAGSNGIVVRDGAAFVTVSLAPDTAVHTLPLDDPGARRATVLTRLPDLPRGSDDLAVTENAIYTPGMTGGEILRTDRNTGETCVLVSGIPLPTSVQEAEGFGQYGTGDLFVTSIDGTIRHIAAD